MRSVTVRLDDLRTTVLNLGFVGENEHTQIRIDSKRMYDQYPTASASLTVCPPDGDSYPAVIERDGDFVLWTITDSDLIHEGIGEIQLSFTVSEVVAKSYIGRFKVGRSIIPTGEIPEPIDDFLTRAGAALTAIPETVSESVAAAVPPAVDAALAEDEQYLSGLKNDAKSSADDAETAQRKAEQAQAAAEDARDAAQAAAGDFQGLTATVSGLASTASPTVDVTHSQGGLYNLAFGIPKGDKGDKGDTGDPAPAEQVTPAVDAYLEANFSNPSNPPLDRSLSSSSSAAPADLVGDLKSAVSEFEDGFTPEETVHLNLLDNVEPTSTTQYYSVTNNGELAFGTASTATYNSYILEVKENQLYTSSDIIRYIIPLDSNQDPLVTSSQVLSQATSIDTTDYTGTKYIAISIRNDQVEHPIANYAISEGSTPSQQVITVPAVLPGWFDDKVDEIEDRIEALEPSATSSDIGKVLTVKTVADGKASSYEFSSPAVIDDTAGDGDTGKTWSADKLYDLSDEVDGLSEDLDDFMDGYGETETIHKNLLDTVEPTSTTQYYSVTSNGALAFGTASTATYNSYIIPVKENQLYTCNDIIRYIIPLDTNQSPLVTSSQIIGQATSIDTASYPGTKYIAISIRNDQPTTHPIDSYALSEGSTPSSEVIVVSKTLPGWFEDGIADVEAEIQALDIKPRKNRVYMLTDTSFSSEKNFSNFNTSAKGKSLHLVVNLSEFTSVTVGLRTADRPLFYAQVTDSSLVLYDYGTGTERSTSYQHGLTISNCISIDAYTTGNTNSFYVKIASNGQEYTTASPYIISHYGRAYPYASMVGSATFVQFSAVVDAIDRPIWLFGDSYLGTVNNNRWAYHLKANGKDNRVMMDGYGGENSTNSYASLEVLIESGVPDYIVWCLGMNDGADSGTTPNATWLAKVQSVIALCEENKIIPILATIPTVPSINNEGKNTWVRESGYQYIDFAKAVGASNQGVWFTGMLSEDNVHPTTAGAVTLYHAALAGCPQFSQT